MLNQQVKENQEKLWDKIVKRATKDVILGINKPAIRMLFILFILNIQEEKLSLLWILFMLLKGKEVSLWLWSLNIFNDTQWYYKIIYVKNIDLNDSN